MKSLQRVIPVLMALALTVPAFGNDQQNAQKLLHKITAMATDPIGRRVVSVTVADALEAQRPDLVVERRNMNLNYGDIYIAHTLLKSGAKMDEIANQLRAGKKMDQIANDRRLDWKQLGVDAKDLNKKMVDNLYKNFIDGKPLATRDTAENYDPNFDGVVADNDVTPAEISEAEQTYLTWKDRASQKKASNLDAASEKAAQGSRGDPVRSKAGKLANPNP